MNERKQRIELLSRINRGHRARPDLLKSLSKPLRTPVEESALLSLPETDCITRAFTAGYRNVVDHLDLSYRRHFRHDEEESVFDIAERLGRQFAISGERAHLLLNGLSDICGAVELPVATLLGNARALIDLDGDTLSIIAINKSNGLLIDYNKDDLQQQYEIAIWGDRWPLLAIL